MASGKEKGSAPLNSAEQASAETLMEAQAAVLVLNYLTENPKYKEAAKAFEAESKRLRAVLEPTKRPMKRLTSIIEEYIGYREEEARREVMLSRVRGDADTAFQLRRFADAANDYVELRDSLPTVGVTPAAYQNFGMNELDQEREPDNDFHDQHDLSMVQRFIEDESVAKSIADAINKRLESFGLVAAGNGAPSSPAAHQMHIPESELAESLLASFEENGMLDSMMDDSFSIFANDANDTSNIRSQEPQPRARSRSPEKRKSSNDATSMAPTVLMPPPPRRTKPSNKINSANAPSSSGKKQSTSKKRPLSKIASNAEAASNTEAIIGTPTTAPINHAPVEEPASKKSRLDGTSQAEIDDFLALLHPDEDET